MAKGKLERVQLSEEIRKSVKDIKAALAEAGRSAASQVLDEEIMVLMRTLADCNPVKAFAIALEYIDQESAKKAFLEIAKEHPSEALSLALQHGDQSLIEKVEALTKSKD